MKEPRVFIVDADDTIYTSKDIESWSNQSELPNEAKAFMDMAERLGAIYSLRGFQEAVNDSEVIDFTNLLIFITNKY